MAAQAVVTQRVVLRPRRAAVRVVALKTARQALVANVLVVFGKQGSLARVEGQIAHQKRRREQDSVQYVLNRFHGTPIS